MQRQNELNHLLNKGMLSGVRPRIALKQTLQLKQKSKNPKLRPGPEEQSIEAQGKQGKLQEHKEGKANKAQVIRVGQTQLGWGG